MLFVFSLLMYTLVIGALLRVLNLAASRQVFLNIFTLSKDYILHDLINNYKQIPNLHNLNTI